MTVSGCGMYHVHGSYMHLGFMICSAHASAFCAGSRFLPSISVLCINWAYKIFAFPLPHAPTNHHKTTFLGFDKLVLLV